MAQGNTPILLEERSTDPRMLPQTGGAAKEGIIDSQDF